MSVRDLHTNYILPSPYNRLTAFLPFLIEPFYEGGRRRYLVSHVTDAFSQPPFAKGVEVLNWNGVAIDRAVETNGNRYAGSNLEARHARGVSTLTVRPLIINLPPDEDWVTITYLTADGQQQELRTKWLVFSPSGEPSPIPVRPDDAQMGYDIENEAVEKAKRLLFAPQVVDAERQAAASGWESGHHRRRQSAHISSQDFPGSSGYNAGRAHSATSASVPSNRLPRSSCRSLCGSCICCRKRG